MNQKSLPETITTTTFKTNGVDFMLPGTKVESGSSEVETIRELSRSMPSLQMKARLSLVPCSTREKDLLVSEPLVLKEINGVLRTSGAATLLHGIREECGSSAEDLTSQLLSSESLQLITENHYPV